MLGKSNINLVFFPPKYLKIVLPKSKAINSMRLWFKKKKRKEECRKNTVYKCTKLTLYADSFIKKG